MTFTTAIPDAGQFVAVWIHNNAIWSSTLRWDGDTLLIYDEAKDEFVPAVSVQFGAKGTWYVLP